MTHKVHSVTYNFIMNFILTATNFIFPLITFPYVARVLLPEGNGKVYAFTFMPVISSIIGEIMINIIS